MTPPPEAPPPAAEAKDGAAPWPVEIRLERGARRLVVAFDNGDRFTLGAELLRAMTPSAAERGHGGDPGPLARDVSGVGLIDVRPVGAYAVRLIFDDGHDTGLYSWAALHRIGRDEAALSAEYRRRIAAA